RGWQRSGALVRLFAPRDGKFVDPRLAQPVVIFASAVGGSRTSALRSANTAGAAISREAAAVEEPGDRRRLERLD
ncbi:MAG TPA: hypothetical protein VEF90_03280, partial [Xanthobacteraceae bacterium]|nr:hypothetical protein [Xanthobacteraceae bacterium]